MPQTRSPTWDESDYDLVRCFAWLLVDRPAIASIADKINKQVSRASRITRRRLVSRVDEPRLGALDTANRFKAQSFCCNCLLSSQFFRATNPQLRSIRFGLAPAMLQITMNEMNVL